MDYEIVTSALERVVVISWLLKDFGWMSTNIYLGWPFGLVSMFGHILLLICDPRIAFRYYNTSLLCWVTGKMTSTFISPCLTRECAGNWLWMSIEFIGTSQSSSIHWGPHVPLSTMSSSFEKLLNHIKLGLFTFGLAVQIVLYVGIAVGKIEMPRHFDDDTASSNELSLLLGTSAGELVEGENERENYSPGVSTAFFEYIYVVCWILKDTFWSLGTGDIETDNLSMAITLETVAMLFGFSALSIYTLTAYIYRKNLESFLDCLTTLFWICANFVWMSGEFFIRYKNSQFDDRDGGNDTDTRIAATVFFVLGLLIQIYIVLHMSFTILRRRRTRVPQVEMFTFRPRSSPMVSSYAPQRGTESDDEVLVLF